MNKTNLPNTANDRVLNLLQSIEPLLINYIKTKPADKDDAHKALTYVRKALAEEYDKLPEPNAKKKVETPAIVGPPGAVNLLEQMTEASFNLQSYYRQQGMQQQEANQQQIASGPGFRWPWQE